MRRLCLVEGRKALEELAASHRLPGGAVDIMGIAEGLGFAVERADLGLDVIARLTIDPAAGEKSIAVNEHYSDEEQRLGIANELVIAMRGCDKTLSHNYRGTASEMRGDDFGRACALMIPGTDGDVVELAGKYRVPLEAAARRLWGNRKGIRTAG